jgi:hypothetical protein
MGFFPNADHRRRSADGGAGDIATPFRNIGIEPISLLTR